MSIRSRIDSISTVPFSDELLTVGWLEWVSLPEFGMDRVHAKLDSGACVSSLHADNLKYFRRLGSEWVRFDVMSSVSDDAELLRCESKVIARRNIRSSSGHVASRPVIETMLYIGGFLWPIEVSLSSRESLEFRLLIGRSALADRCLVDCGKTHLVSR